MMTLSKPLYRYVVHFEEGYESDYTWSGQRLATNDLQEIRDRFYVLRHKDRTQIVDRRCPDMVIFDLQIVDLYEWKTLPVGEVLTTERRRREKAMTHRTVIPGGSVTSTAPLTEEEREMFAALAEAARDLEGLI